MRSAPKVRPLLNISNLPDNDYYKVDTVANATLPDLPTFFVGLSRIDQLKIGVLTPVILRVKHTFVLQNLILSIT